MIFGELREHFCCLALPFLEFAAIWRFNVDCVLGDFVPVCAQHGSARFLIRFVHGTTLLLTSTFVDFLEKRIDCLIALKQCKTIFTSFRNQRVRLNSLLLCLRPFRFPSKVSPSRQVASSLLLLELWVLLQSFALTLTICRSHA